MSSFEDNRMSHSESLAEALLFASGDIVSLEDISIVLKLKYSETEEVLKKLAARYESMNSGIILRKIDDGYQLASRPQLHEEIKSYFEEVTNAPLSRAAMETLTIIAYNQPITRGGIEIIRGVNSDGVLSKLIERGLVCEKGKSENPGRPVLYGTTSLFLKSVGLESLDELSKFDPGTGTAEDNPDETDELKD